MRHRSLPPTTHPTSAIHGRLDSRQSTINVFFLPFDFPLVNRFGFLTSIDCTSNRLCWSRFLVLSIHERPGSPGKGPALSPPGTENSAFAMISGTRSVADGHSHNVV